MAAAGEGEPRRVRRVPPALVWAVAGVASLVAVSAIVLLVVDAGSDEPRDGDAEPRADLVDVIVGVGAVIEALQTERSSAETGMMGLESLMETEVTDQEARRATDRALGNLDGLLGDEPRDARQIAGLGPDTLDELDALRHEIDVSQAPTDLTNADAADEIFIGYTDLISSYLEANMRQIVAIDDPNLREGAVLVVTASRQSEQVAELVRVLLISQITGGVNEPSEVSTIAALWSRISDDASTINSTRAAAYRGIIEDSFPATLHSNLEAIVEIAVAGEPIEIVALVEAVNVPAEESYVGLYDLLTKSFREQAG